MELIIKFDEENLINDIMESFPEASAHNTLRCDGNIRNSIFKFHDLESGKQYTVDRPMLTIGLKLALEAFLSGKFPGVGKYVLKDFKDAGNWDASASDILLQFTIFGEVIYG